MRGLFEVLKFYSWIIVVLKNNS